MCIRNNNRSLQVGLPLFRLKKRAEFLRAAAEGKKVATAGLVLQAVLRKAPDKEASDGNLQLPGVRVGFTVSGKTGNAVVRNRIKRRLRALADMIISRHANPDYDYVLVGRKVAFSRDFANLQRDLKYALHQSGTYRT